ncbi:sialate O-acetylesterase [Niabella drilacis]|uniref:Sialate O-acetylesterase n=1 Tax=Niabella drilacis (strain DSM 25811 / CCM 8410 / CCUG 62505 / LMG 26954 / E90) TaxID=1285928 RepID=A0A1G6I9Y6_NIADE|nr:sialate O-acetylesterase [Niabella drilacis]SDC03281.1 sialate O-acetylesterase [Niabella drilacis]
MKWKCICCLSFLLVSGSINAAVKLPAVIADHMVLQQRTTVALWGWATPGERIRIQCSWNRQPVTVMAGMDGRWIAHVKTIAAGGPYTIRFNGTNVIEINDVLLGEVWLCSGQSNMEFPLAKQKAWRTGVTGYEEEVAKASDPRLRLFTVQQEVAGTPRPDLQGSWAPTTPETAATFSAVAYYFGKEIREATGVPVGLIHSSWGGTPAESWTRKEVLDTGREFRRILDRYETAVKTYPEELAKYGQERDQWLKDSATHPERLRKKPARPLEPEQNSKSPTKLYNAMIHPLIPFTLKGVIWYQGESNAGRAYQYRQLFPAMIRSWRKEWKADFPFYFVQIAPHYQQNPEIREAQLLTYKTVAGTGMAVITDAGDSLNIHPRNKAVVGHRLALWALAKNYGKKNLVYSGPLYESARQEGNKMRVRFSFADGGLVAKDGLLTGFTIAGTDRQFVPATAVIEGNTVVVKSDAVAKPVAVRFGWSRVPHAVLYNKAGLPASPFRTDDWPGATFNKN